jgi:membrane protease YdiL (CAAX protease family)
VSEPRYVPSRRPEGETPAQDAAEGEYDRPYTARARSRPPLLAPASGVVRAFLFLTAALVIGAGVGQNAGVALGAALIGERLPLHARDPAVWQEAFDSLIRYPQVVFCMGAVSLLLCLLITGAFVRLWDRRPLVSVGFQVDGNSARQFGTGLLLGAGLITAVFGVEHALGWLHVTRALPLPGAVAHAAIWFLALLPAAAAEEVMLRGYTFQALEEQWGGAAATLVTALVFGALHGVNPDSGWASFVGIVISGVLFGVAYWTTRRLWLPIGLHVAWNVFEGPVLGFPVSGFDFPSALTIRMTGPAAWTGGGFGPEAGLLGVLACVAGVGLLLAGWRRRRSGQG